MTIDEALQVLSVKHKLDGYYASQTMSLSPSEVAMLENVANANGYGRTNWWCGSCAVSRMQEMMAGTDHDRLAVEAINSCYKIIEDRFNHSDDVVKSFGEGFARTR